MEITMGVLRWQSRLDLTLRPQVAIPLEKLDLEVLIALRMGAYQLQFLDRIPVHAVIHESVELVKQARKRSAGGMVNAVLRKLQGNPTTVWPLPTTGAAAGQSLSLTYAHP